MITFTIISLINSEVYLYAEEYHTGIRGYGDAQDDGCDIAWFGSGEGGVFERERHDRAAARKNNEN
ncbi:hypothetical protein NX437_003743 [Salmonella enterica]|nr:hypothetical protein [Salmonella enterica]